MRSKGQEIEGILKSVNSPAEMEEVRKSSPLVHAMRAVIVVVDLTKSINMKDFKPSRLSVVTSMLKFFFRKAKQSTPIIKFAFAIGENETCKFKSKFTFSEAILFDELERLKVQQDPGNFSMENTLRNCMDLFQDVPLEYNRQLMIIQSSPLTKDHRDIFETIQIFKGTGISLSIISLVGWTNAYLVKTIKLVQAVRGKYITVNSGEEFKRAIEDLAKPALFDYKKVKVSKVRLGLCKKETGQPERLCLCHFEKCKTYFVCNICDATICKEPPVQCPICDSVIVLPTDLYNHVILS